MKFTDDKKDKFSYFGFLKITRNRIYKPEFSVFGRKCFLTCFAWETSLQHYAFKNENS